MTDTGTLFLNQQDVIDAGAADVDWVGAVLEQVFKLHEAAGVYRPPEQFPESDPNVLMSQIALSVCQRTWEHPSIKRV